MSFSRLADSSSSVLPNAFSIVAAHVLPVALVDDAEHVDHEQRHQPRHDGAVDPGVHEARERLPDLAAEQRLVGIFLLEMLRDAEGIWIVSSPSIRIGTLSCLLNAIAALSLTRTGLYSGVSPLCASA